jgi:hypothetical protein
MAEFRKASTDFRGAFEEEMREMERQTLQAERKKAAEAVAASTAAEPGQLAALATPAGTETLSNETPPESGATETMIASPVAEAVPRSAEESHESKTEEAVAGADLQESTHDARHPA